VPQGEPLRTEQLLRPRAEHPGLEHRGLRLGVQADQPVQAREVEGEHPGEAVAPRGQPAHDRRPAAERDQGHPVPTAPVDDRGHVVVVGRADDDVRGVVAVARAHPQQVGRGPAAGVPHPGLVVQPHLLRAEQGAQLLDQGRGEHRVRQPDGGQVDRRPFDQRAERRLDQRAGGAVQGLGTVRVSPAGPVHRGRHALQCDR
jgi:hypothetical protein